MCSEAQVWRVAAYICLCKAMAWGKSCNKKVSVVTILFYLQVNPLEREEFRKHVKRAKEITSVCINSDNSKSTV